jgi:hypothetical protein
VQDHAEQPKRFGPIELVAHRLERLAAQPRVRGGQVNQVAGVRHDRCNARRLHGRAELADFLRRQHASAPLARVLGEDLQRLTAVHDRPLYRTRQSAGDRHMGSEARHGEDS